MFSWGISFLRHGDSWHQKHPSEAHTAGRAVFQGTFLWSTSSAHPVPTGWHCKQAHGPSLLQTIQSLHSSLTLCSKFISTSSCMKPQLPCAGPQLWLWSTDKPSVNVRDRILGLELLSQRPYHWTCPSFLASSLPKSSHTLPQTDFSQKPSWPLQTWIFTVMWTQHFKNKRLSQKTEFRILKVFKVICLTIIHWANTEGIFRKKKKINFGTKTKY